MKCAVSIPGAPVLVTGATGAPHPQVTHIREHILSALPVLTNAGRPVAVIAADSSVNPDAVGVEVSADAPDHLGGFGFGTAAHTRRRSGVLPTGLAIARHLLNARVTHTGTPLTVPVSYWAVPEVGSAANSELLGHRLSSTHNLLVVADGSARRGPKPPKAPHPDADEIDTILATALGTADYGPLTQLTSAAAEELATTGRLPWQVLVAWAKSAFGDEKPDATLSYSAAPFGVGYHVTTWSEPRR